MANVNSTQIAAIQDPQKGRTSSTELGGRLRVAYFEVPAVPTGLGDTMTLTVLPKGARPIRGVFQFSVAQGATATTAIGVSGTTGKYRAAAVTNSTSEFAFITTAAENMGNPTTTEETIIATNGAAAWTASSFRGYILYVTD